MDIIWPMGPILRMLPSCSYRMRMVKLPFWMVSISSCCMSSSGTASCANPMRFGSTAKLLAECKLKYYRISEGTPPSISAHHLGKRHAACEARPNQAAIKDGLHELLLHVLLRHRILRQPPSISAYHLGKRHAACEARPNQAAIKDGLYELLLHVLLRHRILRQPPSISAYHLEDAACQGRNVKLPFRFVSISFCCMVFGTASCISPPQAQPIILRRSPCCV